jgi:hypothetical protein
MEGGHKMKYCKMADVRHSISTHPPFASKRALSDLLLFRGVSTRHIRRSPAMVHNVVIVLFIVPILPVYRSSIN